LVKAAFEAGSAREPGASAVGASVGETPLETAVGAESSSSELRPAADSAFGRSVSGSRVSSLTICTGTGAVQLTSRTSMHPRWPDGSTPERRKQVA